MLRILGLSALLGATVGTAAAGTTASAPTTLATVSAVSPLVVQHVREEMHQMLTRLATSGALGAHPEQIALTIDEPTGRTINLGLLVDATSAANARAGLRVLGATPGSTADRLGVHPGDIVVAVNGRSLRELGADDNGRALAATTLRSDIEALPDGATLQIDVMRNGTALALNGPVQGVTLPAVRLALGAATFAAATESSSGAGASSGCGRINMTDLAPRQEHLYGATILLVDGVTPGPSGAKSYRVDAGTHQLLVAERIPTQAMGLGEIASLRSDKPKSLTITVAPNTTVMVAARFNLDRATKLNDGGYWDPVMWKEVEEACP